MIAQRTLSKKWAIRCPSRRLYVQSPTTPACCRRLPPQRVPFQAAANEARSKDLCSSLAQIPSPATTSPPACCKSFLQQAPRLQLAADTTSRNDLAFVLLQKLPEARTLLPS